MRGLDGARMRAMTLAIGVVTGFAVAVPSAHAITEEQHNVADRFALGNAVWILYHEIGHLLINEFQLPVLGREEDAVDHLATVLLLEAADQENDQYLTDAIDGFFLSARVRARVDTSRLVSSGHGLDEQRAFEVVCLMLGNDARSFGPLADSVEMPEGERGRCAHAYGLARSSWFTVLEANTGGWFNRADPKSVAINYGPAGRANVSARTILEGASVLERAADFLGRTYTFPREVALRAEECGEVNAFFEPDTGEVVICYELVEDFRSLLAGYFEGL